LLFGSHPICCSVLAVECDFSRRIVAGWDDQPDHELLSVWRSTFLVIGSALEPELLALIAYSGGMNPFKMAGWPSFLSGRQPKRATAT
jgi:hypothetical protein